MAILGPRGASGSVCSGAGHADPTRARALSTWLDGRGADLRSRTGDGGLGLLAERAALLGLSYGGRISCGGATRLVRTSDGWVALALPRRDDADLVPALLEQPVDGDVWTTIERAAATLSGSCLRDRAALLGLACAVVGERADDRDAVIAHHVGEAPARPVAGATVVNLAPLWAGPLTAHLLHRMGATVIDVESSTRPDGARATPAFHDLLHRGHRLVQLPLATAGGWDELLALLARADVVIEGSRPRALEQLGIDAVDVVTHAGPAVWLSITAHGRTGTEAMRIGYGDDCAAAGGLVDVVAGEPRFIGDAIADPLTGIVAAAAATQLLATGGRWLVDVALSRVAASMR